MPSSSERTSETKRCIECRQTKPLCRFQLIPTSTDTQRRRRRCRDCVSHERQLEWQATRSLAGSLAWSEYLARRRST